MQISIIASSLVGPDKVVYGNTVSGVMEVTNLEELSYIALAAHICPATFRDNHKNLDSVIQIQLLCFDFDNGTSSQNVHEQLGYKDHLIIGSKSHLKDKGDGKGIIERFHVFIPTIEPITDVALYKYMCKWIAADKHWLADNTVMEASRYFYKHSKVLYFRETGNRITARWCKNLMILEDKKKEFMRTHAKVTFTDATEKFKHTKYYGMLTTDLTNGEGRYAKRLKIAGAMQACGLSYSEANDLLFQHGGYEGKFTSNTLEQLYNK